MNQTDQLEPASTFAAAFGGFDTFRTAQERESSESKVFTKPNALWESSANRRRQAQRLCFWEGGSQKVCFELYNLTAMRMKPVDLRLRA